MTRFSPFIPVLFSLATVAHAESTIRVANVPKTVQLDLGAPPVGFAETNAHSLQWSYSLDLNTRVNNSLIELLSGTAEAGGDDVVDIVDIKEGDGELSVYAWPASLEPGPYHFRVTATVVPFSSTGGTGSSVITNISNTMQLTSDYKPIGCTNGKTPGAFPKVPSPSADTYTSLVVTKPQPGTNILIDSTNSTSGSLFIDWVWRDSNNRGIGGNQNENVKFTSIQLQKVGSDGSASAVGAAVTPDTDVFGGDDDGATINFSDHPVEKGGVYNLVFKYTTNIQDGKVGPGGEVTYTTQEFYVAGAGDLCSGSGGSGSSQPNASGRIVAVGFRVWVVLFLGALFL